MKFFLAPLLLAAVALGAPAAEPIESRDNIEARCNRDDFNKCITGYQMSCAFLGPGMAGCIRQSSNACRNVAGQGDC